MGLSGVAPRRDRCLLDPWAKAHGYHHRVAPRPQNQEPRPIHPLKMSRNHKSRTRLNPMQKGLNFQRHRWSIGGVCSIAFAIHRITEDQRFFHSHRASTGQRCVPTWACVPGDGALQECNLSTGSSLDCGCLPPAQAPGSGWSPPHRMPQQTRAKAKNSSSPSRPSGRHSPPRMREFTTPTALVAKNLTPIPHKFCYRATKSNRTNSAIFATTNAFSSTASAASGA